MAQTYTSIATNTVSGTATTITFSSIPSTYTDLIIVTAGPCSADGDISMQVNGDTASNYSFTYLYGTGSAAGSARASNTTKGIAGSSGPDSVNGICHIMNYANTTTYKTFLTRVNRPAAFVAAFANVWRSTSAINSISLLSDSGKTMNTGFTATLYGIKAA